MSTYEIGNKKTKSPQKPCQVRDAIIFLGRILGCFPFMFGWENHFFIIDLPSGYDIARENP